jgi:hypothetical protein
MSQQTSEPKPEPWLYRASPRKVAWLLFVAFVALYHANVTVVEEGDAVPSALVPIAILEGGTPSFNPERWPELFKWKTSPPLEPKTEDFFFRHWDVVYSGKPARHWFETGLLTLGGPRYYIIEAPRRPGEFVSTFGLLPGLVALPVTAALRAMDPRLEERFVLRLSLAKLHGSLMTAATAAFIFLAAASLTTRRRALLVAFTYGAATCAWAVSSQSLWQQTLNQLFLALGAFYFIRGPTSRRYLLAAGFFLGGAVACRVTSLFVALACAAYVAHKAPKKLIPLVLGAIPLLALVGGYHLYYFGSPLALGQEVAGHAVALEKTGSPELWQTPLHVGLAGLLVSPSRGLLIFSPVMAFAFYGLVRSYRVPDYAVLRPLGIGALAMMLLQAKWFDWWGGWAYGYRPWLDAVPLLALCLIPALDTLLPRRTWRRLFAGALVWSVFVQGLGALTYDRSWNVRRLFVYRIPGKIRPIGVGDEAVARGRVKQGGGTYIGPTFCNIDSPVCRHRLWSIEDSPIPYHVTHFAETRGRRKAGGWDEWRSAATVQESALRAHVR